MTPPPGWKIERSALTRTYELPSFGEALSFVVRVGALAERRDHHPDIDIRYRKVTLRLFTHDANAITEKDVSFAQTLDATPG